MDERYIPEALQALYDLGVFKEKEEQRVLHRHGCPRGSAHGYGRRPHPPMAVRHAR